MVFYANRIGLLSVYSALPVKVGLITTKKACCQSQRNEKHFASPKSCYC